MKIVGTKHKDTLIGTENTDEIYGDYEFDFLKKGGKLANDFIDGVGGDNNRLYGDGGYAGGSDH
jgi:hypothetical protein